ncbi:unnamed protein product [Vicia faba]|uniref:Uncharacterized protein n=1 Tax=Vicia faba TaxID=3906 RepID=A0AAV1AMW3_VICFA|nr:unnamed protein product [Vicia faba]
MAQNLTYPDPPINMALFYKTNENEFEVDTLHFGFKGVVAFHLPFNILTLPFLFLLSRPWWCNSASSITTITYLKPPMAEKLEGKTRLEGAYQLRQIYKNPFALIYCFPTGNQMFNMSTMLSSGKILEVLMKGSTS